MPSLEQILEFLNGLYEYLHGTIALIFIIVGIWVAYLHLKELALDYFERFRDKEHRYRVRTTTVKDMMHERWTQTAKLRRLRVSKTTNNLILDPWPTIIPVDSDKERSAKLAQFYSVPGRLGTQTQMNEETMRIETKFLLALSREEAFKGHREYSTMLIYALDEKLEDILGPPEFVAAQPVGEECFTYEVHLPPNRRFVRGKVNDEPRRKETPQIRVFKGSPKHGHELRYESDRRRDQNLVRWKLGRFVNRFRTRYHVDGDRTDFGDPRGVHDWFRVTILKPPRDEDIHICWCMEGDPVWDWCAGSHSHVPDNHRWA